MKKTIVFEGLSGSGKTTIIKDLKGVMDELLVLNTPNKEKIKLYQSYYTSLDNQTKEIYYLLACSETSHLIQQNKGDKNIVVDRYILSVRAYLQHSKYLNTGELHFEKPNKTIVIDIDDELRKERIIKRENINGDKLKTFLSNRKKNYEHNERARDIFKAEADIVINNVSEDRSGLIKDLMSYF